MKTTYVNLLPMDIQNSIKHDILTVLNELNLSDIELTESIENAMSSRLCDLSDTISISKYL